MDKVFEFIHLYGQEEQKIKPLFHKANFGARTHAWMDECVKTLIFMIAQLLKHLNMEFKW